MHRDAISLAVADPEVAEVLDLETGRYLSHQTAIGADYAKAMQLRLSLQTHIKRDLPVYACAMCGVPVYLVSLKEERRFFFRHTLEDGRCPAHTRGRLSQAEIDAIRYNGVKESRQHLRMKAWVADSLRSDPRFSDVVVEQRWTGALTGKWRKPDVRATFQRMRVAFEVQLSTTYINVIAERREFYLREGGLLFWIFATFNEGPRRLVQDDVFYNNNQNAFVVSLSTREVSLKAQDFHLECVWAEPVDAGDALETGRAMDAAVPIMRREVVSFGALTLEQSAQRAYYFDHEGTVAKIEHNRQARETARLTALRDRFERWFMEYAETEKTDVPTWTELRRDYLAVAPTRPLPEYPGQLPKVLLKAMYSTKHGRPVGWGFKNFIEVPHLIATSQPAHLFYLRKALKAYDRAAQLKTEDKSGAWKQKVREYKDRMMAKDPAYEPDRTHEMLLRFLLPEVFRVVV